MPSRMSVGNFSLLFTLFVSLGFFVMWLYLALFFETRFPLTAEQIGLIIGAMTLVSALLSWAGGIAADRFGAMVTLRITTFGYIFIGIFMATSQNLTFIIIMMLVFGVLRAFNVPTVRGLLAAADDGTGRIFRLRYIAITVSVLLSGVIGKIWHPVDYADYFWLSSAFFAVAFLLAIWGPAPFDEPKSPALLKGNFAAIQSRLPAILLSIAFGGAFWFIMSQFETSFLIYLLRRFGEAGEHIYRNELILAGALALSLALISDQIQTRAKGKSESVIVPFAALLCAISICVVFRSASEMWIYAAAAMFIIGEVIIIPVLDSIISPITKGGNRTLIMGIMEFRQFAFFIGPWLGGVILDWNWLWLGPILSLIALGIAPLYYLAKRSVSLWLINQNASTP